MVLALTPVYSFFYFSCGRIQTNCLFHMGKPSRLFRMSVPSLVWLLPWGNLDKPRRKVSHVKDLSHSKFKSRFCRRCLRWKHVGWTLGAFSAIHRALCCTYCPILELYSAWRESSASSNSADQKDGKNNTLHRVAAFSVQYLFIQTYKILIDQTQNDVMWKVLKDK